MTEPEHRYADWFEPPRSLPAALVERDRLADEIAAIQEQLRLRGQSQRAPEDEPSYQHWRHAAVHALRRKELALKRYRDWIGLERNRMEANLLGLAPDAPLEEVLVEAMILIRDLLQRLRVPFDAPEHTFLSYLRGRTGQRRTTPQKLGRFRPGDTIEERHP